MSREGIVLNADHIARLEREIGPLINADAETTTKYVTNLANTIKTGTGGYGSLIKQPLAVGDAVKFPARLDCGVVTFDAAWLNYASSRDFKNLISTLVERAGGQTPVMVSETDFYEEGGDNSADAIVDRMIGWHQEWRKRENPYNSPSYKGQAMLAYPNDGSEPVLVLVCGTDTEGSYFVGDALTPLEKGMTIMAEIGPDRQTGPDGLLNFESNQFYHHKSIRNYLLDIVDARIKMGWAVEKELIDLVKIVNYLHQQAPEDYRTYMDQRESGILDYRGRPDEAAKLDLKGSTDAFAKRLRKLLRTLEGSNTGKLSEIFSRLNKEQSGIDPELYDICAEGPDLSEKEWYALQWKARKAMQDHLEAGLPEHLKGVPIKPLPSDYPTDMDWPEIDCSKGRQSWNMANDNDPKATYATPLVANG